MIVWSHFPLVVLAYLVGGISPGFWLVRWRNGVDVRTVGSGGTGATNVGRVLGGGAAALVLTLDVAKGAAIAGVALYLAAPDAWIFAAAVAVVAGHIWPVWLGFRGGKGVGAFIGAWLVLAPLALLPCLGLGALCLIWVRRVSIAGLCGLVLLPAAAWWTSESREALIAACVTLTLLLWSHRNNLRTFVAERLHDPSASTAELPTHSP